MAEKEKITFRAPFAPNQNVVPDFIDFGQVYFVGQDGKPAGVNETQCRAYGYTWDNVNNVCRAFTQNPNVNSIGQETNNYTKGSNNTARENVNNSIVAGQNNLLIGPNANDLVVGNSNQLQASVSNSLIVGVQANATIDNSIVLGGNQDNNILGERQLTFSIFGNTSTQAEGIDLYLNYKLNSFYPIQLNSVLIFEIDIVGVETQGRNVGAYMSFKSNGVAKNSSGGKGETILESTTTILFNSDKKTWTAEPKVIDGFLYISVSGEAETTIEWVADIKITQIQTKVVLPPTPENPELIYNGNFLTATDLSGWAKSSARTSVQTLTEVGMLMYTGDRDDNSNRLSRTLAPSPAMGGILGKTYVLTIKTRDYLRGTTQCSIRLDGIYDKENIINFSQETTSVNFVAYRNFSQIAFFGGSHSQGFTLESVSLKEYIK